MLKVYAGALRKYSHFFICLTSTNDGENFVLLRAI